MAGIKKLEEDLSKNGRQKKRERVKLISKPRTGDVTESNIDDRFEDQFQQCLHEIATRRALAFEMFVKKYEALDSEGYDIDLQTMTIVSNRGARQGKSKPFGSLTTYSVSQKTISLYNTIKMNKNSQKKKRAKTGRNIEALYENKTEYKLNQYNKVLEQLDTDSECSVIYEETGKLQKSPVQFKLELKDGATNSRSLVAKTKPEICDIYSIFSTSTLNREFRPLKFVSETNLISVINIFTEKYFKDQTDLPDVSKIKLLKQNNVNSSICPLSSVLMKSVRKSKRLSEQANGNLSICPLSSVLMKSVRKSVHLSEQTNGSANASTSNCQTPVTKCFTPTMKIDNNYFGKPERSSSSKMLSLPLSSHINCNTDFIENEVNCHTNKLKSSKKKSSKKKSLKSSKKFADSNTEIPLNFIQHMKHFKEAIKNGSNSYQNKSDICAFPCKKKLEDSHKNKLLKNGTESPVLSKQTCDLHPKDDFHLRRLSICIPKFQYPLNCKQPMGYFRETIKNKSNSYQDTSTCKKRKLEDSGETELLKNGTETPVNSNHTSKTDRYLLKTNTSVSEHTRESQNHKKNKIKKKIKKLKKNHKIEFFHNRTESSAYFKLCSSQHFERSPKKVSEINKDQIKSNISASPSRKMKPKELNWFDLLKVRTKNPFHLKQSNLHSNNDSKNISKANGYQPESSRSLENGTGSSVLSKKIGDLHPKRLGDYCISKLKLTECPLSSK